MGPAFAGAGVGDAEEHVGGRSEERGEPGDECDGEAEAADFIVREGLLRDAQVRCYGLLREPGLVPQPGEPTAELFAALVGRPHGRTGHPRIASYSTKCYTKV